MNSLKLGILRKEIENNTKSIITLPEEFRMDPHLQHCCLFKPLCHNKGMEESKKRSRRDQRNGTSIRNEYTIFKVEVKQLGGGGGVIWVYKV